MSFGAPEPSRVPPETRRIPQWEIDERSRQLLGGQPVRPQPWRGEYVAPLDVSAPVPVSRRRGGRGVGVLVSVGISVSLSAAAFFGWPLVRDMMPEPAVAAPVLQGAPGLAPVLPVTPPAAAAPVAPAAPAEEVPPVPVPEPVAAAPAPRAAGEGEWSLGSQDAPTPGREEGPRPLGVPAPLASASKAYAFIGGGKPDQAFVAYSPCRPVHYVVRPDNAPPGGQQMLADGFAELSRATGLKFVYDGQTREAPSAQRPLFQPAVYGDRWAPVLVAWTTGQETPQMVAQSSGSGTTSILGQSGSGAVSVGDGPYVYVSGQMKLNAPALVESAARMGPRLIPSVIAHELAHLVGIDHVDDPTQLMYPQAGASRLDFAAGDLSGLAKLGRGPCAPEL